MNRQELTRRLNKLSAKVLKAKLAGNTSKQEKLNSKIDELKRQLEAAPEVETLSELDARGRQILRGKKDQKEDETGIHAMKLAEKMSTSRDFDMEYSSALMKKKSFMAMNLEDQFEAASTKMFETDSSSSSKKRKRTGGVSDAEKERNKEINRHKKNQAAIEKCIRCFDSSRFVKHLVVSTGKHAYLAIPATPPMTDQHCMIIPIEHTASSRSANDSIRKEIELYKTTLAKMFRAQERDVIFLETTKDPRRNKHTTIECIPVPDEIGFDAPIYYKKGIMEADEEWSTNKKLIDTQKNDFYTCIPDHCSYFHVEFGTSGGYAHVIENEQLFGQNFGKEILCGMLEMEAQIFVRQAVEARKSQRDRCRSLKEAWSKFNSSFEESGKQ